MVEKAKFREGISDGGKALKFRCFITKENSSEFPNLLNFIKELQNKKTHEKSFKFNRQRTLSNCICKS